ncbi:MAG: hypothetical protein ABI824_01640 [Acidobacteriota bacterium]
MKKAIFMTMVALSATVLLLAQDASKFNGTWKGDGGQVRTLTFKNGVIYMEEHQAKGDLIILRNYPTQGQEITMTEGVWKDAKATGKMEGNKLVVETQQANGTQWHDEWTMAEDGKSYSALRVNVSGSRGGGKGPGGPGGGAPPAGGPGGGGPGGAKGPGGGGGRGAPMPETFTKIQ